MFIENICVIREYQHFAWGSLCHRLKWMQRGGIVGQMEAHGFYFGKRGVSFWLYARLCKVHLLEIVKHHVCLASHSFIWDSLDLKWYTREIHKQKWTSTFPVRSTEGGIVARSLRCCLVLCDRVPLHCSTSLDLLSEIKRLYCNVSFQKFIHLVPDGLA